MSKKLAVLLCALAFSVTANAKKVTKFEQDVQCMAYTAQAESENQDIKAQTGVLYVIHNRSKRNNVSHCNTINKRKTDFSHRRLKSKPNKELIELVKLVMTERIEDPTKGALFFHDKSIRRNPFKHTIRTAVLDDMLFYRVVGDYSV